MPNFAGKTTKYYYLVTYPSCPHNFASVKDDFLNPSRTAMKAAQFFAAHDIRVVDVPKPEPKEHEALIEVEWSGICGSDLHEYEHGPMGIPPKEHPHPATGEHLPVTLGHEFAGRIIHAPAGSNLKPGQAVMVDPRICCSKCSRCRTGVSHGCTTLGFKGISGTGGGFSETVAVDAKQCYPLPDSVDLALAALIEPLAVAWHAISTCNVSDWSVRSVLVLGGGPIGIACIIGLRARGCRQIYVSEPTATRAIQNEKLADAVLNPITENVGARCRELTAGEGVDVVFDCAGVQKGIESGMDALRFRGTLMNVAVWGAPMVMPFFPFLMKEITVKSSIAYNNGAFEETVDAFVQGRFVGIETMVTSKISIDDIVAKGFEELTRNKDHHIKILVTPKPLSA